MRSFQKLFSKICIFLSIAPAICVFLGFQNLNPSILGYLKTFSMSIPFTSTLRVPPGILAFTPGKNLRRFRKDNNYLDKFDTH